MRCNKCGSTEVIYDEELHALVCCRCGLVIDERVAYQGSEGFPRENELTRYSGAFTNRVHDHGVGGTEISGNPFRYLRKGERWVIRNLDIKVEKKDRRRKKALTILNEYIKMIRPPVSVQETAAKIVQDVVDSSNFKEVTLRRIVAGALFLAYKLNGQPIASKKFSQMLGIEQGDLWEGIRKIKWTSDIKLDPEKYDPRKYVSFITKSLSMPETISPAIESFANKIIAAARESAAISGKNPEALAAAAVYIAGIITNNKRNQLEVGSIIGLTDVAIRNAYSALVQGVDIDIML